MLFNTGFILFVHVIAFYYRQYHKNIS